MLEIFKDDYEMFHSSFQIENFIIIKSGKTVYGMYKQCIRELLSREGSLRGLYAEKMKQEINFEELEEKLQDEKTKDEGSFEVRRLQITRAEMAYGMKDILKVIKETEREYTHFYNASKHLKGKLGDLNEDKREKLESEYWKEYCKHRLCVDYKTTGVPSKDSLDLIQSLPNEMMLGLQQFLSGIATDQKKMAHFLSDYSNKYEFNVNLNEKLPFEVKKLVENNGTSS